MLELGFGDAFETPSRDHERETHIEFIPQEWICKDRREWYLRELDRFDEMTRGPRAQTIT